MVDFKIINKTRINNRQKNDLVFTVLPSSERKSSDIGVPSLTVDRPTPFPTVKGWIAGTRERRNYYLRDITVQVVNTGRYVNVDVGENSYLYQFVFCTSPRRTFCVTSSEWEISFMWEKGNEERGRMTDFVLTLPTSTSSVSTLVLHSNELSLVRFSPYSETTSMVRIPRMKNWRKGTILFGDGQI